MDLVKKNIISIIMAVIAIAAVISVFTPLGTYVKDLQADLDKSKQTNEQMQAQLNKKRSMPQLDPTVTEQPELTIFPNQKQIDEGKAIIDKLKAESISMRDAAVGMNKHTLLVPQSLPMPPNQGVQFQFRDAYTALMQIPGPGQLPKLVASMKPGLPPTPDEVTRRKQEIHDTITKERVIKVNNEPTPQSQQAADQEIAIEQAKLPDEMRMAIAKKSLVYVNSDAFEMYPAIQGTTAPDPVNIYAAQLMLWVQQDVIDAINECNKGSADVTVAPVKRVIKVQAPPIFFRSDQVPTSGDPDAEIKKAPTLSATGRASNPLYDVVHFTMNLDVDATQLDKFLHDLNRNRLINPLSMNVNVVDSAERSSQGYAYGNAPVVNVQMDCEALFMRAWSVAFMPPAIKASLGITEQPAAPAEGQQPAASAQ